jgi:hypothetical protein
MKNSLRPLEFRSFRAARGILHADGPLCQQLTTGVRMKTSTFFNARIAPLVPGLGKGVAKFFARAVGVYGLPGKIVMDKSGANTAGGSKSTPC